MSDIMSVLRSDIMSVFNDSFYGINSSSAHTLYEDASKASDANSIGNLDTTHTSVINHDNGSVTLIIFSDCDIIKLPLKSALHARQVISALQGKLL